MFNCHMNLPETYNPEQNPLNYEYIQEQQQADKTFLALQIKYPSRYINKCLDDNVKDIICYVKDHDDPNTQWKIALPDQMVQPTIKWFHQVMGHPGQTRLNITLKQRYYHPKLRYFVDRLRCDHCQRHKLPVRGYSLLPERELCIAP